MNIVLQIVYTVLVLGVLIFIHELGHFLAAKAFRVKVNEFALGMGPTILKKQGKQTLYSLRLFPIGGFCQLEGEDAGEDGEITEGSMQGKPVWQRMIVVVAGAAMNLLLGVIITAILVIARPIPSLVVADFLDNAVSVQTGLQAGDKIVGINGKKVAVYTDFSTELSRCYKQDTVSLTVLRDGAEVILPAVQFPTEAMDEELFCPVADFRVYREEKTVLTVVKYTLRNTGSYVTMMYQSLADMITGRVSIKYVSGPIGMSGMISEAVSYGWASIASLVALISINLAVMNMLPLPALDGGRFLFMLIELIRGKPVNVKYEAAIHAVGFGLLMLLTLVIAFKDIFFPVS